MFTLGKRAPGELPNRAPEKPASLSRTVSVPPADVPELPGELARGALFPTVRCTGNHGSRCTIAASHWSSYASLSRLPQGPLPHSWAELWRGANIRAGHGITWTLIQRRMRPRLRPSRAHVPEQPQPRRDYGQPGGSSLRDGSRPLARSASRRVYMPFRMNTHNAGAWGLSTHGAALLHWCTVFVYS
jgi:hypothetical protein